jgi:hypothetical protein
MIDAELDSLIAKEKFQSRLTNYIVRFGKWLVLIIPIIFVIITIATWIIYYQYGFTPVTPPPNITKFFEQDILSQFLVISYLVFLSIYFINSILLLVGALKTKKSLNLRLKYERKQGKPIESLDGFRLMSDNVNRVLNIVKLISIICIISVILFIIMLFQGNVNFGFAAMASSLVGLGLAMIIRSLNLNIHDVNGLQDFYKPTTHSIFLDNYFSEVLSNHLDPITFLKWDEYLHGISKILNRDFTEKIQTQEKGELPVTFAVEKILFLYYLKYQNVLKEKFFLSEFNEVIDLDSHSDVFDAKKGLYMEGDWYFSEEDIYKLFEYIRKYNPGFFNIIDRLQLELADNIERVSNDPIYMDSTAQEKVYKDSELNIMIFFYNNATEEKNYRIRVEAPGFEPRRMLLNIKVEGRGAFKIPTNNIPLFSEMGDDIAGVLSTMVENGDTIWMTLEPRQKGEQTIQIYLEDENGVVIEGKTRTVKVSNNMKAYLKKLGSLGSVIGGIGMAVARILPVVIGN